MSETDPPVVIEPHDPAWPRLFDTERDWLVETIGTWLVGQIEHVGSTAVPGLAAKPIIDVMAPVRDLESSRAALVALSTVGYNHAPYRENIMHWLCKPSFSFRTHHLHLVPFGSELWFDRLLFRDHLRATPAVAREYEALKRGLAERHRHDREAYTDAKSPFVEATLKRAAAANLADSGLLVRRLIESSDHVVAATRWLCDEWPDPRFSFDARRERLVAPADCPETLLATSGHEPIAVVAFRRFRREPGQSPSLFIDALYTRAAYRRRGVATKLVEEAVRQAWSFARELFVYTEKRNWYEKRGWVPVKENADSTAVVLKKERT